MQLFIDKKNLKKMKKIFKFILYLPVREKTFSLLLLKIIFLYIPEREKVFLLCDHLLKIKQKKNNSKYLEVAFYIHLKITVKCFSSFYNIILHTQPTFIIHFQEDFYIFHDIILNV